MAMRHPLVHPTAVSAAALVAGLLAGCASPPGGVAAAAPEPGMAGHGMAGGMMAGKMALATLTPTQGSAVRGLIMFHAMDGRLMLHAKLSGLAPGSVHGFHVHETGSCASPDAASAGGHFMAAGQPHGPPGASHHTGDLPALQADGNGNVDQKFMLAAGPTLDEGAAGLVGRSVIVHADADDYTTQPTGNIGGRLACGVIAAM
jgi:Cu-Zn family superoxide dismutase